MPGGRRTRPTSVELIARERERHYQKLGFTPEHDDAHTQAELLLAACAYALPTSFQGDAEALWPFSGKPKRGDRIKDLTRAGALIVAELDRLRRMERPCEACDGTAHVLANPDGRGWVETTCSKCNGTGVAR